MSCANTSLPWFIDPPRAMLPRGVAKPKFEIQIETKKINRLCVFHQQLNRAESTNVGTLLIEIVKIRRKHHPRLAMLEQIQTRDSSKQEQERLVSVGHVGEAAAS